MQYAITLEMKYKIVNCKWQSDMQKHSSELEIGKISIIIDYNRYLNSENKLFNVIIVCCIIPDNKFKSTYKPHYKNICFHIT